MEELKPDMGVIHQRLKNIILDLFGIDMQMLGKDAGSKNLLGNRFRLKGRDLMYLYFEIEKAFDIRIPESDIVQGRFSTFNSIAEIINEQLEIACQKVV